MLSVIWHGWLGGRKGIQPVKTECWFADGDFTTEFWLLPLPSISSLLSLHFNGHSPGQPGLPGAKDDGSGGDSYRSCKAPVKSSPPTNQYQVFFYRPDALPVAQPTVSKHGRENITSHGLAYPKLTWGLPTLSLTTNSSWLPWGGLPCLSSALWCQYPSIISCHHKIEDSFMAWSLLMVVQLKYRYKVQHGLGIPPT